MQIFPSQIYVFWVLLIYSFHAPFHPSSRNTETPIKVIRLHPGPRRKEPIIAPHAKECPMNTGPHMCAPAGRVPSWRACVLPLHEGGGPCLRMAVREKKPLQMNLDLEWPSR